MRNTIKERRLAQQAAQEAHERAAALEEERFKEVVRAIYRIRVNLPREFALVDRFIGELTGTRPLKSTHTGNPYDTAFYNGAQYLGQKWMELVNHTEGGRE
jgi:hypothetical protein